MQSVTIFSSYSITQPYLQVRAILAIGTVYHVRAIMATCTICHVRALRAIFTVGAVTAE